MTYIQIALNATASFRALGMPWAQQRFEYFLRAFRNLDFLYALRNTLMLNFLDLLAGFPVP